ncbi:hypothetical protein L227DRAFT_345425 [Lentinus tigrinus ALCF2SS1-6]|uniref:Secreted protein n=1 Tax=Lentinus tigrinus ALCF2SS1-6 TaxID=1328759 RepID=A0A5C2RW89_9APHY|nr:hypothetical protein L227DRAFT_345425 [Lentinus tigrinus ALCF2SS1-6]
MLCVIVTCLAYILTALPSRVIIFSCHKQSDTAGPGEGHDTRDRAFTSDAWNSILSWMFREDIQGARPSRMDSGCRRQPP